MNHHYSYRAHSVITFRPFNVKHQPIPMMQKLFSRNLQTEIIWKSSHFSAEILPDRLPLLSGASLSYIGCEAWWDYFSISTSTGIKKYIISFLTWTIHSVTCQHSLNNVFMNQARVYVRVLRGPPWLLIRVHCILANSASAYSWFHYVKFKEDHLLLQLWSLCMEFHLQYMSFKNIPK